MGANQSFETDFADVTGAERKEDDRQTGERKYRHYTDGGQGQQKRRKAKPASPHRPNVAAVTHNAVSLTWLPPRHTLHAIIAYTVEIRKPRQAKHSWVTLTKNCQGTHYDARHLDSDTEYVFRVRAENIFGTGKPSAPSSTVTTKIFEMSSDLNCYISPTSASPISPFIGRGFPKSISYEGGLLDSSDSVFDVSGDAGMVKSPSLPVGGLNASNAPAHQNQYGTFKRRHSFNVQLNGRVSTILNHSDRFYSSSSLNSSTSTIVVSSSNVNNNNNNNDTDSVKTRSGTILRNNIHRTSLQPTARKTTIPILFPGTGSNSLNRLRESRASLKSTSSSDVIGNHSTLPRHRGSLNRNIKSREFRNSLGSTASDSNTNTTSSTSSSTSKEDNNNKTGEGSRLSLQSVLSDVTMSNQSHSSDDLSSRPLSFLSELGENSELGSFLNGGSIGTDSTKIFNGGHFHFDNDKIDTVKSDDYENCLNDDDEDDIIYKLKRDLKNIEITEEKLKFHDLKERLKSEISEETSSFNNNLSPKDYYQTLDNPWERDTQSVNGVSENIMAAPFSDDIKIALNAKHNSNDVKSNMYRSTNQSWGDSGDRDDFRTLRSVLQSNHIIVKQSRSMPEVVGVVLGEGGETRTLTRGKLTTIEDEDEEEEAVRVTTL